MRFRYDKEYEDALKVLDNLSRYDDIGLELAAKLSEHIRNNYQNCLLYTLDDPEIVNGISCRE